MQAASDTSVAGTKRCIDNNEAVRAAKISKKLEVEKFGSNTKSTVIDLDTGAKRLTITFDNGCTKIVTILKPTVDILGQTFDWESIKFNKSGYPKHQKQLLHTMVHRSINGDIQQGYVVAHKNDVRHDFNRENLMAIPRKCNLLCQKSQAKKQPSGNFVCRFEAYGVLIITKTCPSACEALHALDILKLTHPSVPDNFKPIIFEIGLNKPEEFMKFYTDIDSLLARAHLYTKKDRKKQTKRESQNTYILFSSIQDMYSANIIQPLIESVETALKLSEFIFEPQFDAILYYHGAKGGELATLVEKESYTKYLEKDKPCLTLKGGRILTYNSQLSVVFMDRCGQNTVDGLEVCHGRGKALDNRRRTLWIGTKRQNMGDIGDKNKQSSAFLGVYFHKGSGKFRSSIHLDQWAMTLGSFENEVAAASAYNFVSANETKIKELGCSKNKKFRAFIRACACAGEILPYQSQMTDTTNAHCKLNPEVMVNGVRLRLGWFENNLLANAALQFITRNKIKFNLNDFIDIKECRSYVRACAQAGKMLPRESGSDAKMNENT